jgi:hypothetical protein
MNNKRIGSVALLLAVTILLAVVPMERPGG